MPRPIKQIDVAALQMGGLRVLNSLDEAGFETQKDMAAFLGIDILTLKAGLDRQGYTFGTMQFIIPKNKLED